MSGSVLFKGFPKELITFLEELRGNNNKIWFEAHRQDFDRYFMEPARDFVLALGDRLQTFVPEVVADPRTDRSIFRLHRDTRFSSDKSPYKTNLALWFWEGDRPRMENSGFYFHLEPPNLMVASGIYIFPPPLLKAYREAVVNRDLGPELVEAIRHVAAFDSYSIGGEHYKKVPRGYDPEHPLSKLLLYNGLTVDLTQAIPEVLFSPEIVDYTVTHYRNMLPIHRWLVSMMASQPQA